MNKKYFLKVMKIWILEMYVEAWVDKMLSVLHNIKLGLETSNSV